MRVLLGLARRQQSAPRMVRKVMCAATAHLGETAYVRPTPARPAGLGRNSFELGELRGAEQTDEVAAGQQRRCRALAPGHSTSGRHGEHAGQGRRRHHGERGGDRRRHSFGARRVSATWNGRIGHLLGVKTSATLALRALLAGAPASERSAFGIRPMTTMAAKGPKRHQRHARDMIQGYGLILAACRRVPTRALVKSHGPSSARLASQRERS